MDALTPTDTALLLNDIATRAGTGQQIAGWYGMTIPELRAFTADNMDKLTELRESLAETAQAADAETVTPTQLDDLWITNKFERLRRLQDVAEILYDQRKLGDAVTMREFRSYLMLAANELGQLLHRGSGEAGTGDTLSVDIQGVDMDTLR